MKDTTGELSMTVIVLVGAVTLAGIVTLLMPKIKTWIDNNWNRIDTTCPVGQYRNVDGTCKPY